MPRRLVDRFDQRADVRQKRASRAEKMAASCMPTIPTELRRSPEWKLARRNMATAEDVYDIVHRREIDLKNFEETLFDYDMAYYMLEKLVESGNY